MHLICRAATIRAEHDDVARRVAEVREARELRRVEELPAQASQSGAAPFG